MTLSRREMLAACAAAVPALALAAQEKKPEKAGAGMGIVIHSYGQHSSAGRKEKVPFQDPIAFVEFCHARGAGGVQVGIGRREQEYIKKLRDKVESLKMYLEGIVGLPKDKADLERFTADVKTAKEAGASVLRTVILSGRRYETFDSADAFRKFADNGWRSLTLAEPVVAKLDARLAVENHKDWRADELIAMLKRLDSKHVGVCVDTGNSIALLEEPLEVVEAYAPWAFTTHFKDMGVAEYDEGFLLSEVPLGKGFLDLKKIVEVLRKARPEVRLNLEMITRDPLKVPCLTSKYWATFETLPGKHLADALARVRKHAAKELPKISHLTPEKRLEVEDANVRQSMTYAREKLA